MTRWFFCLVVLLLAGCASAPPPRVAPRPSLNGTIAVPGLTAWPDGAVLELRLVDFTQADRPAVLVTEQSFSNPGIFPLRFRLPYDPATIDARRDYGLECRVSLRGRPRWATPQIVPVLTRGRAVVLEISLQPVAPHAAGNDGR